MNRICFESYVSATRSTVNGNHAILNLQRLIISPADKYWPLSFPSDAVSSQSTRLSLIVWMNSAFLPHQAPNDEKNYCVHDLI